MAKQSHYWTLCYAVKLRIHKISMKWENEVDSLEEKDLKPKSLKPKSSKYLSKVISWMIYKINLWKF